MVADLGATLASKPPWRCLMFTTWTVSVLLTLSALTLAAAVAIMGTAGIVLFLVGFSTGWLTSCVVGRVRRRRRLRAS